MADAWYFFDGARQLGPLSLVELRRLLDIQSSPMVRVWHAGLAEWTSPAELPEFGPAGLPPPLPPFLPPDQIRDHQAQNYQAQESSNPGSKRQRPEGASLRQFHCKELARRVFACDDVLGIWLSGQSGCRCVGGGHRCRLPAKRRLSAGNHLCFDLAGMAGGHRYRDLAVRRCLEIRKPPYRRKNAAWKKV